MAIMSVFNIFALSTGNLNDITLDHVKMNNIAVVGSTNLTTNSPLTAQRAWIDESRQLQISEVSFVYEIDFACSERLEFMRLVNVELQDLAVALYFPTHPTLWSRTFCCTTPSSARDGFFDFGFIRHECPCA